MARQHGVDPRREKQDVRSGHDENSAWFENPGEFCQYGHLVVDMLDAFRVKDTLEGVVFVWKRGGHVTWSAGETVGSGPVGKEVGALHLET